MKPVLGLALVAALSSAAVAATDPRTVPTQLPPAWQAKTRAVMGALNFSAQSVAWKK